MACLLALGAWLTLSLTDVAAQASPEAPDGSSTVRGLELYGTPHLDRVRAGHRVTYTLTYTNDTGAVVPNAVITTALSSGQSLNPDNLSPPYLAQPPIPADRFSYDNRTKRLEWRIGDIPPGSRGRITLVTRTDPTPEPRAERPLRAVGASARLWSASAPQISAETLAEALVVGPLLTISKVAGPDRIIPGRRLVYTLTVTNLGDFDRRPDSEIANGVAVADPVPEHTAVEHISIPGRLDNVAKEVAWHLSKSIEPGSKEVVTFSVLTDPNLLLSDQIINTGYRVKSSEMLEGPVEGRTIRTNIDPLLEATVTTPLNRRIRAEAHPGQTITYTVAVRNPHRRPLDNVAVSLTLPVDVRNDAPGNPSFKYVGPVTGRPAPSQIRGQELRWTGLHLPAWGAVRLQFHVKISPHVYTPDNGGVSRYVLGSLDAHHPETTFPAVRDGSNVNVAPNVRISKIVDPRAVRLKEPVTYTIVVENLGDKPVTGIVLSDTVRAETADAPMNFTVLGHLDGPAPVSAAGFPLVWENLTLGPEERIEIRYRARANGRPVAYYVSDIATWSPDQHLHQVRGAARVLIDSPLDFKKSAVPAKTFLDTRIKYHLTVENLDEHTYHLTRMEDHLPGGIRGIMGESMMLHEPQPPAPLQPGGVWTASYDVEIGQNINCSMLPSARINTLGTLRAELQEFPGISIRNRPSVGLVEIVSHVSTNVTATRKVVLAGTPVTYTLHLRNTSSLDATDRTLQLDLPPGFQYLWAMRGGNPTLSTHADGHQIVTYSGVTIPAGRELFLEFQAAASGVEGRYTADFKDQTSSRVCVEGHRDVAEVQVVGAADQILRISTKRHSAAQVAPGSPVEYEIAITNFDRDPFTLATVRDTLPHGFSLLSASGDHPGTPHQPTPEVLEWRNVQIPGDSTRTWRIVTRAPVLFGQYVNRVSATASNLDIAPSQAEPVNVVPQLLMTKVASESRVRPGDSFTYTITVVNNSSRTLTGVRITDTLPAPFSFVRTLSAGDTTVTAGPDNRQPVWSIVVRVGERRRIVFQVDVSTEAWDGTFFNRLNGYHPDVILPNIEDAAPVMVVDSGRTERPTPGPSPSPLPTRTPMPTRTSVPASPTSLASVTPIQTMGATATPEPTRRGTNPADPPTAETPVDPNHTPGTGTSRAGRIYLPFASTPPRF